LNLIFLISGKTLLARACAAQTKSTFLKLAGPQLVQMFIGDGAKLVRDAFALAKEKAPAIIFIDELDAIGTKRFDSEKAGDREVQRTMLELLNQLDGFSSTADIKVCRCNLEFMQYLNFVVQEQHVSHHSGLRQKY
jgi:26S proteasome regulatory subunit T5